MIINEIYKEYGEPVLGCLNRYRLNDGAEVWVLATGNEQTQRIQYFSPEYVKRYTSDQMFKYHIGQFFDGAVKEINFPVLA